MDERRKFPRKKVDCFIWYHKKGEKRPKIVISRNISGRGVMFLSENYLPRNTDVKLKLKIPNVEDPLNLKGKVIRSQATTGVHLYKIAIKFSPPSKKLHYLLTHQSNKN